MKLHTLHILCDDDDGAEKAYAIAQDYESVIQCWKQQNQDSVSLFLLVSNQDQELFDELQNMAEEKDAIRLIVQHVDASFPMNYEDEKKEEEENSPGFFDIISREQMAEIVKQRARLNGSYLSLVVLSSIVATIALAQGNIAILIGAMVLTPLLGPNLALAFSTAMANGALARRAVLSGLAGFGLTFLIAFTTGSIMHLKPDGNMFPMLVEYGFESIPVAVCAGLAATILLLQGTLSSLIGVMVAVAFLPPIAMSGLLLAAGNTDHALKAALLFAVNLAAFNLAAKTVLLLAGVRPRKGEEEKNHCLSVMVYLAGWLLAIGLLSVGIHFK